MEYDVDLRGGGDMINVGSTKECRTKERWSIKIFYYEIVTRTFKSKVFMKIWIDTWTLRVRYLWKSGLIQEL